MDETRTDLELVLEDITDAQTLALAQFVKRLNFAEIEGCAVDVDEAYVMRDAIVKLQIALERVGYAPR